MDSLSEAPESNGSVAPEGFSWNLVDETWWTCESRTFPGLDAPPEGAPEHAFRPEGYESQYWEDWIGAWDTWSVSAGGFPTAPAQIYGDLTAPTDRSLTLRSMEIDVVSRRSARSGVVIDRLCLPPVDFPTIGIDLDRHPPTVVVGHEVVLPEGQSLVPAPDDTGPALTGFPHTLGPGETLPFLLWANAYYCDCTWRIDVHWSSEGDIGTLTLDDDGEPFRTVGAGASEFYHFDWRFSQWLSTEPRYEGLVDD